MKTTVLKLARAFGLFAVSRWLTRDQLRILCYHGIWIGPQPHYGDCLFMDAETFAARMQHIKALGYRVIPLDEAMQRHTAGRSVARDIVITIDDAWLGTYSHMLPILDKQQFPATLYVTTYYTLAERPVLNVMLGYVVAHARKAIPWGELLTPADCEIPPQARLGRLIEKVEALPTLDARHAEVLRIADLLGVDPQALERSSAFMLMNAEQVRDAHQRGVDIQLHTHTHRMHGYEPPQVVGEIALNRAKLAAMLGAEPATLRHFCYPSGEYHPRVFDALRSNGVVSATTTEFGLNAPGTEPLAMKRILDCQSLSDIELEARLSGFWSVIVGVRQRIHTLLRRPSV